ncbi:transcriptional repressor, partial [Candidatus Bipolaricaulota bacterium]|nr:transcriptional repressor [Candidatus Bipolaricaulota bacterium]
MNIPEAMKFLRAAEKRITPQRKLLLRIISDNAHLDASEIYRLAKEEDEKISLSTVYRTVRLLEELGLVEASGLGEDHYHYEVRLDEHYHL